MLHIRYQENSLNLQSDTDFLHHGYTQFLNNFQHKNFYFIFCNIWFLYNMTHTASVIYFFYLIFDLLLNCTWRIHIHRNLLFIYIFYKRHGSVLCAKLRAAGQRQDSSASFAQNVALTDPSIIASQ